MSPPRRPAIEPLGDGALLVILGGQNTRSATARSATARSATARSTNARVHAIAAAVRAEAANGVPWGRPVPSYESVLVPFDADALDADVARSRLAELVARVGEPARAADVLPVFEIPTRYGGPDGPDLDEVAHRLGLSPAEVVALHAGRVYVVLMLGFSPGFAYLGTLPRALEVPRRAVPRTRVPAGSVAIAARQTGVYPTASPGGWNLIGRTDASLWDPRRDPPTPLGPGRRVRFVPIAG